MGDQNRAIVDYDLAIRLDPTFTATYTARGLAYERKANAARATADFQFALSLPSKFESGDWAHRTARERLAALEREKQLAAKPPPAVSPPVPAERLSAAPEADQWVTVELLSELAPPAGQPMSSKDVITPIGRRVALVIGISAYEHVPALANPMNDATDIAASLARLGFNVRKETELDYDGLRRALREFAHEASGSDLAAIFFAGHGIEVDGQNYLIPVDARLATDKDVTFEAIPLDYLLTAVEGAGQLGLVLLDSCRDNPFAASMKMASATRSLSRGLSRVEPTGAVLVGFAAKEGTIAADGDSRNSPYTAALLHHLETPGLEVRLLFGKVRDQVRASTDNAQDPFFYGSLGGEPIYLIPPGSPISADYAMAAPATEPAHQTVVKSGWNIQIGVFPSQETAHTRLEQARKSGTDLLSNKPGFTMAAQIGDSIIYWARFSGFTETSAREACKVLDQKGLDCLPLAP